MLSASGRLLLQARIFMNRETPENPPPTRRGRTVSADTDEFNWPAHGCPANPGGAMVRPIQTGT